MIWMWPWTESEKWNFELFQEKPLKARSIHSQGLLFGQLIILIAPPNGDNIVIIQTSDQNGINNLCCDFLSSCFSFVGFGGWWGRGEGRENRALMLDNLFRIKSDQKKVLIQKGQNSRWAHKLREQSTHANTVFIVLSCGLCTEKGRIQEYFSCWSWVLSAGREHQPAPWSWQLRLPLAWTFLASQFCPSLPSQTFCRMWNETSLCTALKDSQCLSVACTR